MAIDLIDTIKPKNNGTFPMVEAEDVVVGKGTAEEKRLPEALEGKLTEEEADARYLKQAGGTVTGDTEFPSVSLKNNGHAAGELINIKNGPKLDGAIGINYVRTTNNPNPTAPRKRFMGVTGGDYDTRIVLGDGSASNADGMIAVFGLHFDDDRLWARHDLWFTDKQGDQQGARNWWGLVADGDELRIVKDKGTPVTYAPKAHTHAQADVTGLADALSAKQDKLVAGEGIAIAADGKTISATGGGGGNVTYNALSSGFSVSIGDKSFGFTEGFDDARIVNLSFDNSFGSNVGKSLATTDYVDEAGQAFLKKTDVDGAFLVASENPVQNKVIANWRAGVPTLTWNGENAGLTIPNGNYQLLFSENEGQDGVTVKFNMGGGTPFEKAIPLASKAYVDNGLGTKGNANIGFPTDGLILANAQAGGMITFEGLFGDASEVYVHLQNGSVDKDCYLLKSSALPENIACLNDIGGGMFNVSAKGTGDTTSKLEVLMANADTMSFCFTAGGGTFEKEVPTKSYVDGLVGDISAALAAI